MVPVDRPSRNDWTDRMFRRIRRLTGLELYLHVLVSAELIGIVYDRALEAATRCPRLITLCRAFVCDELAHVGFESQLLLSLREGRHAATQSAMRLAHRTFFACTAVVVWCTHLTVFRRAGVGGLGFLRACLSQDAFYLAIRPRDSRSDDASR
jgi:hypothetical protein